MKTLTALITALALFTFAGAAFASNSNTHCTHVGDNCVSTQASSSTKLTQEEMLP